MLLSEGGGHNEDTNSYSRGAQCARAWLITTLARTEGAGKAGCRLHPRPRVRKWKAHELVTTGSTEAIRLSLHDGVTVSFVLSPVTGLSCHRRLAGHLPRDLMPASGHQDHTTSPSAMTIARQPISSRPSHPAPNTRDDREAPLLESAGRADWSH
jgi:hypothetical protein